MNITQEAQRHYLTWLNKLLDIASMDPKATNEEISDLKMKIAALKKLD